MSYLSILIIPPLSYLLDLFGFHSKADDVDRWAERRGWWHR